MRVTKSATENIGETGLYLIFFMYFSEGKGSLDIEKIYFLRKDENRFMPYLRLFGKSLKRFKNLHKKCIEFSRCMSLCSSHIFLIQISCMRSTNTSTPYTKIYLSSLFHGFGVYICMWVRDGTPVYNSALRVINSKRQ